MIKLHTFEDISCDTPTLSDEDIRTLSRHDVLNLLNVLQGELALIGLNLADNFDLMSDSLEVCRELHVSLNNPAKAIPTARQHHVLRDRILSEISEHQTGELDAEENAELRESISNIIQILHVFERRAEAILQDAGIFTGMNTFSPVAVNE